LEIIPPILAKIWINQRFTVLQTSQYLDVHFYVLHVNTFSAGVRYIPTWKSAPNQQFLVAFPTA